MRGDARPHRLSPNLPRSIALDPDDNALARSGGEKVRASRTDLISLPAVRYPRLSLRRQDSALIGARRQLGALEEVAANVPHNEPSRRVEWRERIGSRASRVVAVAHAHES